MFGVVPRVIWERLEPPDPVDATVPLATRPLLIEGAACGPILVEPGIGRRWNEKARQIFKINNSRDVVQDLEQFGVGPASIRIVILTHFHLDHAGAAVESSPEGGCRPVFPHARHLAHQSEIDACLSGEGVRRASYRAEDARTLLQFNLLDAFTESELHVTPEITIHTLGGHSDGVSIVMIRDGGQTVCFWSDVVPTRNHVNPFYVMAFDANAEKSYHVRRPWIERAVAERWINALYHDPKMDFAQFTRNGDRWLAEEP